MKHTIKKLSIWLLTAVLLVTALAALSLQASAADAASTPIYIGSVQLSDGDYLATDADTPTETKPASGSYAFYNGGTLTLHDFTLTGDTGIGSDDPLTVVLEGKNVINVTNDDGLENDYGLTIKGSGSLTITTMEYDGIEVDDGDLIIESGTITITVLQTDPNFPADGIDITDGDIYINGGTLTIVATDHGIESDNSIEDDEHFFGVYINGGTVDITAKDEGIDAEDSLEIKGGTVIVRDADIGLDCGGNVLIEGGTIDITSQDDGIEASDALTVNGGSIKITSEYNAIESYWDMTINGGSITANAAVDGLACYGTLTVNGGSLQIIAEDCAAWGLEIVLSPEVEPAFGKIVEEIAGDGTVWYYAADKNGNPLTEVDSDVEVKLTNDTLNNTLWLPVLMKLYNTSLPITASTTEGGEISGEGTKMVKYGRNYTYTITPDEGYAIADVLVNGKSVGAVSEYTFTKVRRAQVIEVIFAPDPEAVPETPVEEPADDIADPMYSYEDIA
ncbi:MAG: carbohydrate-binding domain-containing protein [Clostridia bacterium]|nr:carbohydrate-binding domain-containing protein [Clostridia bacterium]